jgi:hypothetical protein
MVSVAKTRLALTVVPILVLGACSAANPASAEQPAAARMIVIEGKDVSGTVYKKLGLPSLHYCWEACLKESRCSGARWGVIRGDQAGLCLLLSGELTLKARAAPKTEDGKPIQVTAARKESGANGGGT